MHTLTFSTDKIREEIDFFGVDLHRKLWRLKTNVPKAHEGEVKINGFKLDDATQNRIAEALNTPIMDFGDAFEKAYEEIWRLARDIKNSPLKQRRKN